MTDKNYAESTIKIYGQIIQRSPEIRTYDQLLHHIGNLQESVKPETINQMLVSLRLHFEYRKEQGEISRNLAKKVQVKNSHKPYLSLLKRAELEELYAEYPQRTSIELRQKILLGLLVYQGADLGTTKYLGKADFNLEKCEIYLPQTRRKNSRRLGLDARQLLPLNKYLEMKKEEEPFFLKSLTYEYKNLLNILQKQNNKIESIRQIRSSVITNWLSQYNLREVQYYCGHKHIGSTESYQRIDLESMKKDLKKYHPLG